MILATPGQETSATPLTGVPAGAVITARLIDGDETLPTVVTVTPIVDSQGMALTSRAATFTAPPGLPVTLQWLLGVAVVGEELVAAYPVTQPPPPLAGTAYATVAWIRATVAGTAYAALLPVQDATLGRLLALAEQDLDAEAWPLLPRRPGARKLNVLDLTPAEREGLAQAVSAQVVYRLEMGDEHFVRAQRQRVQTKTVTRDGKLPIIGPQTSRELTAAGLWRLTTSGLSARVGGDPDRWQSE